VQGGYVKDSTIAFIIIGLLAFAYYSDGEFNFDFLKKNDAAETSDTASVRDVCPDDGTTDLNTKLRNPLNSTADYLTATLYWSDLLNNEISSVAQLGTGAYKQSSTTTECGKKYKIYTKNDGAYVYAEKTTPVLQGSGILVDMDVPRSSELEFKAFDENGDNQTSGYVQDTITSTAEAMASGGNLVYKVLVRTKVASAQFGSSMSTAPTYICVDADPSKFSTSSGVSLSGSIGAVKGTDALPKYCSDNSYESYWIIPPVKSSDGTKEMYVTIRADLGDPTTDVKLMFVDSHKFLGGNGRTAIGSSDDSATETGETNRYITINLS
jgi:hypothetical protein